MSKTISDTCWIYAGPVGRYGYPRVLGHDSTGLRPLPQRVLYEDQFGEIPQGLELDHLCRNPTCVNPDHLEPVTHAENMRRALPYKKNLKKHGTFNRSKTHCRNGHPYTPENTYTSPRTYKRKHRVSTGMVRWCRKCKLNQAKQYQRRKAEGYATV